jgi:hypothetical protein
LCPANNIVDEFAKKAKKSLVIKALAELEANNKMQA